MKFTAAIEQSTAHKLDDKGVLRHDVGLVLMDLTNDELCDVMSATTKGLLTLHIDMPLPNFPEPPQPPMPLELPITNRMPQRGVILSREERL